MSPQVTPIAAVKVPSGSWRLACLGAFVLTLGWSWWLFGDRLMVVLDEGIYLDGGVRVLAGQVPYRDFFALTGPGTFGWLALLFRIFGVSLSSARIAVVLAHALMATSVLYLASRRLSLPGAAFITFVYVILQTVDGNQGLCNHRLDSAAVALLAVVTAAMGSERKSRAADCIAGALAAAAAWFTPPVALLGATMIGWLAWNPERRRRLPAFLAGSILCSAPVAGWLAAESALTPMAHHLLWTSSNYSRANFISYGGVIGGYSGIFSDATGAEAMSRAVVMLGLAIPVFLPFMVWGGWLVRLAAARRRRDPENDLAVFLLLCSAALLASAYPRWDQSHIRFVSPVFFVLAGWLAGSIRTPLVRVPVFLVASLYSSMFLFYSVTNRVSLGTAKTPAGRIHGDTETLLLVDQLIHYVRPGDRMFAFPYMPMMYFVTGAKNPTRYSFLQPGMMTEQDERSALDGLQRNPPEWILYSDVPPRAYLRTWPSSDPARLRMESIEKFIREKYSRTAYLKYPGLDFEILRFGPAPGVGRSGAAAF